MCGGVVYVVDGWLVSCSSCLFKALLPSSPSWSLFSTLVPSCSSLWLLGPASLWHSYSSKLWFCLVRRFTIATKVCTYLSRAVVRGSSLLLLLVAIERVSTIQLFCLGVGVTAYPFPTDGANWWCWKSSINYTVLTCSRQNLRNKEEENLTESTSLEPTKYPSNVKLENVHNPKVPKLG